MHYERPRFPSKTLPLFYRTITLRNDQHNQYTHFHKATEIIYIHEGTLRIHIDRKPHLIGVGQIAAIPSNISHLMEAVSPKCSYTVLIFESEALLASSLIGQPHSTITEDVKSLELFEQLMRIHQDKKPFRDEKMLSILTLLMIRLIELQSLPLAPLEIEPTPEIMEALYYMCRHYREDLRIEDVAQTIGYHPDYLSRVFKRITGQTIVEYLTALRCDLARRQLMDGRSVSYAARRSGFSSLNYFSRVYKKFYGIPPRAEQPDFVINNK